MIMYNHFDTIPVCDGQTDRQTNRTPCQNHASVCWRQAEIVRTISARI